MTWVWYLDVLPVQQPVDQDRRAGCLQNRLHLRAFHRLPPRIGKQWRERWIRQAARAHHFASGDVRCWDRYLFISNMVTFFLPNTASRLSSARISRRFSGFCRSCFLM
jgi:hypothetical protein